MPKPPLHHYLFTLNHKAVHIECLDENRKPIRGAYASGFIVQEDSEFFLYTCWHVVTGFNMHNVEIIPRKLPNRKFIKVNLQNYETRQPGIQAIGGNQYSILELYNENGNPLWIQNKHDVPNEDLNSVNIKVPFWHDAVKLPLPKSMSISELQYVKEDELWDYLPQLGEKMYVVGYPYGYSALGEEQPTAITLTRFLAADRIKDRQTEMLLDGPGAPGMSGGPIFIERNSVLYLLGIYTGLIYPDFIIGSNEKTTALGTMSNLVLWKRIEKE